MEISAADLQVLELSLADTGTLCGDHHEQGLILQNDLILGYCARQCLLVVIPLVLDNAPTMISASPPRYSSTSV